METAKIPVGAWHWLDEPEKIYLLEQGAAELYVVDESGSSRVFLAALKAESIVRALPPEAGVKLLLIATEETTLAPLDAVDFLTRENAAAEIHAFLSVLAARPDGAKIEIAPLDENISIDELKAQLDAASDDFAAAYRTYFADRQKFYNHRLKENAAAQERLAANSYGELLKHFMTGLSLLTSTDDENQPPVVQALQYIAEALGLPKNRVKLPPQYLHLREPQEIFRSLGAAAGLHARPVVLEDDWYNKDQGPLLVKQGENYYAAIPSSPSSYELYDVAAGTRRPLDESTASAVEENAYAFYRSMPDDVKSVKSWLSWAGRLCWPSDYWQLFFACLIIGFIPVITPLITQTVFEDIIPSYDKQAHLMVVQVMLVASLAGAFTSLVRGIGVMRVKEHIRVAAESALWLKLLSLPASFFRRYQIGDLSARMQGLSQISIQLSSIVSNGIFNGLFCFFNLLVMFYFSWKLSLAVCLIWAVFFVINLIFSWRLLKFSRRSNECSGLVSGRLIQVLDGLSQFKVRAAEARAFQLWSRPFGEERQWKNRSSRQQTWLGIVGTIQPLVMNFIIFYAVMQLFDDGLKTNTVILSQANFLSFNSALGSFGASVSGLISGCVSILGILPSLERIEPILKERAEVSTDKLPAGELKGEIEITGLNFRYTPERPLVLKDISLKINPGEFVAIVGPSGSGKSTLLRVILGLEQGEKGIVEYDGQDLSQLDITSVRRQVGVVMQQGRLMGGSIFSNIVGALPLTQDDAWEAARLVGLADDIKEMPMGMFTIVSDSGGNISGGQRQRIMIARSLAGRPRIVVFDEATSALDNTTQAIVSDTLEKLKATRVIVAHRLSTIKSADRIIVLERGSIVESGSYDELMDKHGRFYTLAARQML